MNRHLPKKKYKWPQTYEKMLNITNIKEMQIKTMMRYHLITVRMAIINKPKKITAVDKDGEKLQPLGDVKSKMVQSL